MGEMLRGRRTGCRAEADHRYCRIRGKESAVTGLQMDFDTVESSESPEMRECRLASKPEEFAAYPVQPTNLAVSGVATFRGQTKVAEGKMGYTIYH